MVELSEDDWRMSPTGEDVAVAALPLPPEIDPFELSLESLAIDPSEISELSVGPGDEVYMCGRFAREGMATTEVRPFARFGSISLMADPEFKILDGRRMSSELFVIEMRSHNGFSGSPVFVMIPQQSFRGTIGDSSREDNVTKFRLIGVDCGHIHDKVPVVDGHGKSQESPLHVVSNTNVSLVVPIWKVLDILSDDELAKQREEAAMAWFSSPHLLRPEL